MKKRSWTLIAFILVVLVQLYVPAQMIWSREEILTNGTEYKFRTAPIDPNDPFRGKFIILDYEQNQIPVADGKAWNSDEEVYVWIKTDTNGFVKIHGISKTTPVNQKTEFVQAKVQYVNTFNGKARVIINYPFDRFYMEESLAPKAEETYMETQLDTTKIAYALVKIKDGKSVLKDVFIDSVSITQLVKTRIENSNQ